MKAYQIRRAHKQFLRQLDAAKAIESISQYNKFIENMKEFRARVIECYPVEQITTKTGEQRRHQRFLIEDAVDLTSRYHDRLVIDVWDDSDMQALANGVGFVFDIAVTFSVSRSKSGAPFNNIRLFHQELAQPGAAQPPQPGQYQQAPPQQTYQQQQAPPQQQPPQQQGWWGPQQPPQQYGGQYSQPFQEI